MSSLPWIVINTIPTYIVALEKLLASLLKSGIRSQFILIVVANSGHPEIFWDELLYGNMLFKRVHVPNNLYEYSAFVGAYHAMHTLQIMDPNAHFLLLHDTCVCMKGFKQRLMYIIETQYHSLVDILWMSPDGQCNIGLFTPNALDILFQAYHELMTLDKMEGIEMEWGNHPLSPKILVDAQKQKYVPYKQIILPPKRIYSQLKRTVNYFPSIDVEKYNVWIKATHEHPNQP